MADLAPRSSWVRVWTRAVVGPASRRFQGTWIGLGLVASVIFGGTGMMPHDLTSIAFDDSVVGVALGVTWILLFLPTARVLLRAEAGRYLRSLPHPAGARRWIAIAAMTYLQLPWLVLWVWGEGAIGLGIVAITTVVVVSMALVILPPLPPRYPRWSSGWASLRGLYFRALRRRAGDAIVRAIGFCLLAGLAAGLMIRNNHVEGVDAAIIGGAIIELLLVPARAGLLGVLAEAHRQSAWLAATTGVDHATRVAALATVVTGVNVVSAGISLAVIAVGFGVNAPLVAVALGLAVGDALSATASTVRAATKPQETTRVVLGAVIAAAICMLAIGVVGATGVLVALAAGAFRVLRC